MSDADAPFAPAMPSAVYAWDRLPVEATPKGSRRVICDVATATLLRFRGHVSTIRAGEAAHPPHRHPDEELVLVHRGELEITINDRVLRAPEGSLCFFAAGDLHGMRNPGPGEASYFVLRFVTERTGPGARD